jgi:signal peptidase I
MSIEVGWAGITVGAIALFAVLPALLGRGCWPWSTAAITALLFTLYALVSPAPTGTWGYLGYVLVALAPLALLYLVLRYAEEAPAASFGFRLPSRGVGTVLAITAGLVGVYELLLWEPALLLSPHVGALPRTADFAVFFLTIPVLALGQEAVFRGYFLTKVSGRLPFRTALFASAAFFALAGFEPFLFVQIPLGNLVPTLFTNLLLGFTTGIFLGLLFYKTEWSLLAPWTFRTAILWVELLVPLTLSGVSWTTGFILELIALSSIILLLFLGIKEPRFQARHFLEEPRQLRRRTLLARARSRQQVVPLVVVVAVAVVLVGLAGPVGVISSKSPVRLLAIATPSMVPALRPGTLVAVESVGSAADIHLGDIIAYDAPYLDPSGPVVHRVVAIANNGSGPVYTLKGDANSAPDPRPVAYSQIEGKVVGNLPYVGLLILYPQFTIGLLLVIVVAFLYRASPEGIYGAHRRPVLPLREEYT